MLELLGIILLVFFVWLHYKNVKEQSLKRFYFAALVLKILAGVSVGLVYKYYYIGGDTWSYFNQAEQFSNVAFLSWNNFTDLFIKNNYVLVEGFTYANQPRAALMVKLVVVVNLFTHSNYWITSAYFSFFSFMGVWAFSSWVYTYFRYGKVAALVLFIWPSFVFWSSGILKESVAVGLIFLIIAAYFKVLKSKKIGKALLIFVGVYLLFLIKYYYAVVLIVVLLVNAIMELSILRKKSLTVQFLAWFFILVAGLIMGGMFHPNLSFNNILEVIVGNNQAFIALSNNTSIIYFVDVSSNWLWLVLNSPKALFASLFMPLGLSRESIAFSLSAFENWILLALFLRGLFFLKINDLKLNFKLLLASMSYVIILAVFLALSTPNLGTLARYKVAFIPMFLVLVFVMNKFRGITRVC